MPTSWIRTKAKDWFDQVKKKDLFYWARLLITVAVVQSLVTWTDNRGLITDYRYAFYRLLQKFDHHKSWDQNTVVIVVDDEEYYKGLLQGRVPIKRDYLARLI